MKRAGEELVLAAIRRVLAGDMDLSEAMADRQVLAESMLLAQDMYLNATWGMFQTTKDGRYLNANAA